MKTFCFCIRLAASLAILAILPVAAVTFTSDTTITFYNTNYDGQDIALTNCTVTIDGLHSFASLHVLNQGKLTHTAAQNGFLVNSIRITNEMHVLNGTNAVALNSSNVLQYTIIVTSTSGLITYSNGVDYTTSVDTNLVTSIQRTDTSTIPDGATVSVSYSVLSGPDVPSGINLVVAGDVLVDAGGSINVIGQGYGGYSGPGSGGSTISPANIPGTGAGGGHGGYGGLSASNAPGGNVLDVTSQPADKGGTGGPTEVGLGGAGGGAVKIFAGGLFRIDGSIVANGANGISDRSGGGAGGGIWLSAQTITGAGSIVADGGAGEPSLGGGGGGGRIALYFENNTYTGILSAHGGNGWQIGGAGTIYKKAASQGYGDVVVDNNGRLGTNTLLLATEPFSLTIKSGAIISLSSTQTIGNLLISANGWISLVSNWLNVLGDATIQPGGGVTGDGTGFAGSSGPGFGRTLAFSGTVTGGGAGYGGSGGSSAFISTDGTSALGGSTYGFISQPIDRGSGGGTGTGGSPFNAGGSGGGAVLMTVMGTLALDGKISADGKAGQGEGSGGGSGGSVWLTVNSLTGSGMISVNGGAGNGLGGGGGGGRMAVYYQSKAFAGALRAVGGFSPRPGGAGTVYTRDISKPVGQVVVDNGGQAGATTPFATTEAFNLLGQAGAMISLFPNNSGTLTSLSLSSNAWFISSNSTLVVTSNATIAAGAGLIADGGGYAAGSGPGAGRQIFFLIPGQNGIYTGGGAGHGGYGGNTSAGSGGGSVYDPSSFPTTAGSGGGTGSDLYPTNVGGAGGGVIRFTVNGLLQLDGKVSADGITPVSHNSGGGSGGAIQLTVGTLSGSGLISAIGGAGTGYGGGGGGGRVAINYTSNLFTGTMRAWGGGTTNIGGAGTIYSKALNQSTAQMLVDNGGHLGTNTDLGTPSSGLDLSIKGGGLVSYASQGGPPGLTSLLVGSNSWLFLGNASVSISSNATIQAGGGILADGLGYPGGAGPGFGRRSSDQLVGGGGGYGGYGGNGGASLASGGIGNGFILQSTTLGSGGGAGSGNSPTNAGGAGGGSIRLTINGTMNLNGRISANGLSGLSLNCGGGSGGSVSITAGNLTGSGIISANGGAGTAAGGGGGGGRIVLQPAINQFLGVVSAFGGTGFNRGGAGTIYSKTATQTIGLVLVDNGGSLGTNTSIPDNGSYDLTVTGGGVAAHSNPGFSPRTLLILSNGWVSITNQQLTVSGNATVQAGGGIIANGTAFTGGQGAGFFSFNGLKGGGGYGGAGGGNPPFYGRSYGSLQFPVDQGSSGSGANGIGGTVPPFGGLGGGAVHLVVSGFLALDGRISANGANGDVNSGGGSGGSIWLNAATLIGGGAISANGGSGNGAGGGGGGGRVALTFNTNLFNGPITAFGGDGAVRGGAGTIYIKANNQSAASVVLDNGGQNGTNSGLGSFSGTIDVTLNSGTLLSSVGLGTIRNLVIGSNAWLTVSNASTPLNFLGNVNIQSGGGIIADGTGSPGAQGSGPGSTLSSSSYGITGGGAGHGGLGAASAAGAGGGNSYDSAVVPGLVGSGGGSGAAGFPNVLGGNGGGAILLNVTGSLLVQGRISADGLPGNAVGSGGGAGGALALTVGTLSGTGAISANGGGGNGYGGGGGGGRIAINYQANTFAGTMTAFGGGGFAYGGAGTVFTKPNSVGAPSIGLLIVDNGGHFGTNTPLAQVGIVDLTLGNGAIGYPSSGYLILSNLTVNAGGTLTTLPQQTNLDVGVLGQALIAGAVTTDGKGYAQSVGPGAGLSTNDIGSGGGYGGIGGASSLLQGGITYGSAQQPVDKGSGGGPGYPGYAIAGSGSDGGGAIRLSVARTLTINGSLSANGNPAFQEDGGGGAGGSIWINANSINGAGVLTAEGGSGELYQGGGGGGGRLALYARTNAFTGQLSAFGGGGFDSGQDGSIYLSTNLSAPAVIAQTPTGVVSNGISIVDFFFNTDINPDSVSASDISIVTPTGPLSQSGVVASSIGPSSLRVSFPLQTSPGVYSISVGPEIEDLFAQPMAQAYAGGFTISVPVIQGTVTDTNGLPVSGVMIQPDVGSSATTDINGQYAIGVLPGGSITITPSSTGLMFVPGLRSYANISSSVSNQNFLAVSTIAPALASSQQGTNILVNWSGLSGVTYQTFYSVDLTNWFPYGAAFAGTNGPMQVLFPIDAEPAKFFRLGATN